MKNENNTCFTELLLGDSKIINVKDFCKLYSIDILINILEFSKMVKKKSRKAGFSYGNNCKI